MKTFYDCKIDLTSALIDFIKACDLDGRDFQEELDDCLSDAESCYYL